MGVAQGPRAAFNKGLISWNQYQDYETGRSKYIRSPYTELVRRHVEFRRQSQDLGNSIREANEREAVFIDNDTSNTGSLWLDVPHDALQGTRAYALRTGGAVLAGMADLPSQADGLADAYAEYGEVRKQHGYLVATSNFCGLLAPCEASYNVDIITYQPIGDERERTYHASNGFMQFSGTCFSVVGGTEATTSFASNSGVSRLLVGRDAPNNGAAFFGRVLTPHVDDLSSGVVKTFTGGRVTPSVTQADTVLYRVSGEEAGRVGSYLTRTKPTSRAQAMSDLALDPAWGNSRVWLSEVRVPAGTPICEGTAAAQGALRGGGNRIFIPREWLRDDWFQLPSPLR